MIKDIFLPDLGEGINTVEVSEVLVKSGDTIKIDDTIIILESEKATMEIPIEFDGVVTEVLVEAGDEIKSGALLIRIESEASDIPKMDEQKKSDKEEITDEKLTDSVTESITSVPLASIDSQAPVTVQNKVPFASPSVRLFARELGADLSLIAGSGPKGRITKEDVQSFIKSVLSNNRSSQPNLVSVPAIDFSQWGEIESVKLSKIKRITGDRLQQAWQSIPHVTQFDEADITELDEFRKTLKSLNQNEKIKVSFLPFLLKAVVQLLKDMPEFNASLDHTGQNLVYKKYFHVGVAVDTQNGLVVPVIRNVDTKNFRELSEELVTISEKARGRKLLPDDMKGGCFTISSLGGISGTGFTPIVNPPEVAILGVSRSKLSPVFRNGSFQPRMILPYSLSYDHRVIDGAQAARFTKRLNLLLENFAELKGLGLT
ncbi:MAG: 2-oxo acid dehydrogenase subunit E2 [Candidatus Marinimicrobia bacterium]|nr:2-oxo acid dehydrogenase subunit E2 [Candidatus Neomarinimicrobiota bacterium]